MAACPKCGKGKIKARKGIKRCPHCGPFPEPPNKDWKKGLE